jgi:GNAT superfamily N-acetyltransferase
MGEVVVAVSDVDDGLNERLEDEIYAINAAATGLDDGRLLRGVARGRSGELLAGLCGWTWGGCGYVEFLWVRTDQRGHGLGTQVLNPAGFVQIPAPGLALRPHRRNDPGREGTQSKHSLPGEAAPAEA